VKEVVLVTADERLIPLFQDWQQDGVTITVHTVIREPTTQLVVEADQHVLLDNTGVWCNGAPAATLTLSTIAHELSYLAPATLADATMQHALRQYLVWSR
jgi:hypothetical protein